MTQHPGFERLVGAGAQRRKALRHGWRLAAAATASTLPGLAARATPPNAARVSFLSREEGVTALAGVPGDRYYDAMGLLEIRARVNAPLDGVALADARRAVRAYDAAAVLAFSDEERIAIGAFVADIQPALAARAPLHARTPWSFVKLADRAEGGMPHTRGPHIVMPAGACAAYVRRFRERGDARGWPDGRNLLVHEQTHVLQRAYPALFEPLYTEVFGFTRMAPAPTTPWLDAHVVTNPDGPELAWVFPLATLGGSGWVMPCVTLPDIAQPRMPQDFQAVAVDVLRGADGWKVALDIDGRPRLRDLDKLPGYDTHFPFPDEDFHPNEIAAVLLSHWILQDKPGVDDLPLMAAAAAWARRALA